LSKFYLAARFSRRGELRGYRAALQALGHTVTSRWIDLEDDTGNPRECAIADFKDIAAADALVVFIDAPRYETRGAHHTEFGIGLALGKRLIVVGTRSHIFHHMPAAEFYPQWPEALAALSKTAQPKSPKVVRRIMPKGGKPIANIVIYEDELNY
jgi:hypothetical protein